MNAQEIMNQGFNNREKWSEIPDAMKEEFSKAIGADRKEIFEEFLSSHEDDTERYYFALGLLHGAATWGVE